MKKPWNKIASRTGVLVDQHGLRAENRLIWFVHRSAIGRVPVIPQLTLQVLNNVVRSLSPAVEPVVDNHALFADLGKEVTIETGEPAGSSIGQIYIGDPPAAQLVNFAHVVLDPIAMAQRYFLSYGDNDYLARVCPIWVRSDFERNLLIRGV